MLRGDKSRVVPAAERSPSKMLQLRNECRPFYAGFRIVGRAQRLLGCCFLENLASTDPQRVRAKRASLYLLYPLGIWCYHLAIGLALFVDSERHKHAMKDTDRLNKTIFVTFMAALHVEAVLNNVLLLVQAPKFVELLRICGLIEIHTAVPPYVQRKTVRFAWVMVLFQVTIIILNVALNIHSHFGTVLLIEEGRQLNPLLMNLAISNGFLGVMYLTSMCLSTRLLLMYISRAVALYLGCIYKNLDQCLRSRSTPESRKVLLVDHMRVQLALLKNCVDLASSLLGPSLLYAYAYSVAILCAAAYYTIIPELEFRVRLFFFFFGSLHWLSVLLPTITTHRMKAAVIELRSAVQGVSMANYSDDLLAQLRMMLNSMKHDDLRFTGCGFFVVDLSTFADIMGAVITYTVVLVQTNESYLRGSLEHCTNNTAV
ncbi:gustatory receptor 68a [Rhipicephalus sanguineus]|uniref:gustatory receptor 68a n=1 Tax=Rhipicephalus sanguineus TaxID=34632 RepID=UPI0018960C6E|nr:gustatory receptor 68a [Rhipicephalus sanguineus]